MFSTRVKCKKVNVFYFFPEKATYYFLPLQRQSPEPALHMLLWNNPAQFLLCQFWVRHKILHMDVSIMCIKETSSLLKSSSPRRTVAIEYLRVGHVFPIDNYLFQVLIYLKTAGWQNWLSEMDLRRSNCVNAMAMTWIVKDDKPIRKAD